MRRHFRSHRRKRKNHSLRRSNNSAGILLIIALAFVISLVSKVVNFLITNAETIKLIFNISLIIVAIGSVICLIAYLINKKCAKYICAQSTAIQNINNLNEKYKFNEIECMDVEHCYDNANFYGDISPTDFLIYQLTYTGAKAKTAITHAEENKRAYEEYCAGIALISKTDFDVPSLLKWYLRKKEDQIFNDLVQYPVIDFTITVRLFLTKINGVRVDEKETTFNSKEIICLLEGISKKDGSFYSDRNVWDAICRVERGKVSNKMRFAVYSRDGNRCRKCGSSYDLEVDHIFPISKGGKTVIDNLQTLCHNCNVAKSNKVEDGTYDPRFDKKIHICPNCGVSLVMKNGRNGKFYACPNYPNCKYTRSV